MALKKTSSTIIISGAVTESAANTFTEATIDLQLNPLDNEVFVIQSVDMDADLPDAVAGTSTLSRMSLSNTSRTTLGTLEDNNVFAYHLNGIRATGAIAVGFTSLAPDSVTATKLDYIGILATDSFYAQIQGTANAGVKKGEFKVYGYRARADSSTYAALVQSELLSA